MPVMLRPDGLAKKIAYSILGKPANIAHPKSQAQSKIGKLLTMQETIRVR